jgi:hypothetical protein
LNHTVCTYKEYLVDFTISQIYKKNLNIFSEEKKKLRAGSGLAKPHRAGPTQIQRKGHGTAAAANLLAGPAGQPAREAESVRAAPGRPIK